MFRDHWLYGVGAGAFAVTYPYYSIERADWFRRYAHSDWLQYPSELGAIGAVLLGALLVAVLREQWKARHVGGSFDWMAAALVIGMAGIGLHALVDFPVHIPGVVTLAVVLASLLTIPAVRRHHEAH